MQNEINRAQWSVYFKEFSRSNEARPTRVEIFGAMGAQPEAQGLPLMGINVEYSGPDAPRLELMLGGTSPADPRHVTHTITQVKHIWTKLGADGREEAIEIEDQSGTKTLLQFTAPAELSAKN